MTPLDAFAEQARYCRANDAPVTATLVESLAAALDERTAIGRRVLAWPTPPVADALALRLTGGVHALWRRGEARELDPLFEHGRAVSPDAVRLLLDRADAYLQPWLDGPPQTNEPGRSAQLMTGLLEVAARHGRRLELLEVGSSAGLNLLIGGYRIELGAVAVGPVGSPVHLRPTWRGSSPPDRPVEIVSARGVDIAPVDGVSAEGRERLLGYVWADHHERFARMENALAMLATHPPRLDRGDAADWIEARLHEPQPEGVARVLMHSVVWPYLSKAGKARITVAMERAGAAATAERPLAWVAVEWLRELSCHDVTVRSWPDHGEPAHIARSHAHGFWVERL